MPQRTICGNDILARQLKLRRKELGLTIEEAAARAGVGTKTWCRYEAGASIRKDKCKGICKALNWRSLPGQEEEAQEDFSAREYRNHEAWSEFLEKEYGVRAAVSFAVGSDILYDNIKEDLSELASMPVGTHIGQLRISRMVDSLPEQFLMQYNYEFLYQMKCALAALRMRAKNKMPMTAHSVMEELLLYLSNQEASILMELSEEDGQRADDLDDWDEWVFDLFDDSDLVFCLYSNQYLPAEHAYHFSHWAEQQFYIAQ